MPVLDRFLDKGLFSHALEEQDVPHPRTIIVDAALEVDHLDALDRFFVKPRNSQLFHNHFGVKAFLSESGQDLADRVTLAQESGLEVMLQEYIPGPPPTTTSWTASWTPGAIRATFARTRLRMHPPQFGNSSYMVSIPRRRGPGRGRSDRLLKRRATGGSSAPSSRRTSGMGLQDPGGQRPPWWFVEFAANCGVNVVEMAYRDALGEPVGR
jgi:D-aspartate ligase